MHSAEAAGASFRNYIVMIQAFVLCFGHSADAFLQTVNKKCLGLFPKHFYSSYSNYLFSSSLRFTLDICSFIPEINPFTLFESKAGVHLYFAPVFSRMKSLNFVESPSSKLPFGKTIRSSLSNPRKKLNSSSQTP